LGQKHYVYWWADGVYFNLRLDEERTCVLVLIGATEDGTKELLAVVDGAIVKALNPGVNCFSSGEKIVSLIGEALHFDRFGDPQQMEPDLIFSNGSKVGIEVTTAYYLGDPDDPNLHAREEWQFARNPTFNEHGIHQSIDPRTGRARVWDRMDERLKASYQLKLNEKCSKQYAGSDRLWLAIYAVGRVTESYEYDRIIQNSQPFMQLF
jgi:hypothetical protein